MITIIDISYWFYMIFFVITVCYKGNMIVPLVAREAGCCASDCQNDAGLFFTVIANLMPDGNVRAWDMKT